MTTQNYLIIENNVVTNVVLWDGGSEWMPPADSIQLIQATTPAIVWTPVYVDGKLTDWVLAEVVGAGDIDFTWDGSVVTTNQPKPAV